MMADASATTTPHRGTSQRSALGASRVTLAALLLRDLVVLKKHFGEFVIRTLVQPFLLCFVFLFVFRRSAKASAGMGDGGVRGSRPCSYLASSAFRSCSKACSPSP